MNICVYSSKYLNFLYSDGTTVDVLRITRCRENLILTIFLLAIVPIFNSQVYRHG